MICLECLGFWNDNFPFKKMAKGVAFTGIQMTCEINE